jgi:hypothetical protein
MAGVYSNRYRPMVSIPALFERYPFTKLSIYFLNLALISTMGKGQGTIASSLFNSFSVA